jgi:hypothetical protein
MAAAQVNAANAERARAAWALKGAVPPWVLALAEACDKASQGAVAKRLGISSAVVNQVLGCSYKGRLDRFEERVRGELMNEKVLCPVLGQISKRDCLDHQGRKYRATNPLRVKLFQTCPTCPNREDACSEK